MAHNMDFKSIPENYRKEMLDLKRNTVRKFDDEKDIRKEICDRWINNEIDHVTCTIFNTHGLSQITKVVTDITKWDDIYIISW